MKTNSNKSPASRSGQSLVEILLAITIGSLIVGAAIGAIQLTLKSNAQNTANEQGTPLAQELGDEARSLSESSWFNLYNTTRSSDYFVVSDNGLKVSQGVEGVLGDDIKPGLIGHWKLDESSLSNGSTIYDTTSNGNKGILNGTVTGSTQAGTDNCKVGGCINFNGTDNYVSFGQVLPTAPASPFTMSAWINSASSVGWKTVIGTNGSLAEITINDATINFGQNGGGGWWITDTSSIAVNTWHYVVGVFDGSMASLYVDGVIKSGPVAHAFSSNHDITLIGKCNCGSGEWMNGKIDDARVYNRALSVAEITQLYRSNLYTRSFVVNDVSRDGSGNIVASGGTVDPSTLKVTAKVNWPQGSGLQFIQYLTRFRNSATDATDWVDPSSYFSKTPGADTTTNPGQIQLLIN